MTDNRNTTTVATSTPTDDALLEQLFATARAQTIDDDGFTERVMQRVADLEAQGRPGTIMAAAQRVGRLTHLWTLFCLLVAAMLFVLLRGWIPIAQVVYDLFAAPPTLSRLLMLPLAVAVLVVIALGEVVHRERLSPI